MSTAPSSSAVETLDKLYEFDREPVSRDRLLGPAYFAGSFAGEHVAATEFVIGVLFVNWGATIRDVFFGLAIGNVLAVLTWTLLCAPIAVQTRLTLYWYLRRIGGPIVTLIYNLTNAVLFCILAGCMITVAASAVRIPFGIPAQVEWYPSDWRFVALVLLVGAVVVALATLGFERLASFATVCSPWMFLMFLSGAIVALPVLAGRAGVGTIDGIDAFWRMGEQAVWTGVTPDGSPPMGFWRIAAFAWICNLAMHGGLSDMALFRYAKKASYGLFSAFGMFLGHYLAWICAGVMGAGAATLLNTSLQGLDSGEVAYQTLGAAGAIAVVIAGWTTSNPTLYRAGLALQAVTPNWSRVKITVVAGVVTTVIACFPFVFTRLLDFVGIYGLLLAPAGAIVVAEHWIFPKIGLTRYWIGSRALNWPALVSWVMAIGIALYLERSGTLHLFFLFVPVYTVTIALYVLLASVAGAKDAVPEPLPETHSHSGADESKAAVAGGSAYRIAGAVALCCLIACFVFPLRVWLAGTDNYRANLDNMRQWLIVPTLLYFVSGTLFFRGWRRSN